MFSFSNPPPNFACLHPPHSPFPLAITTVWSDSVGRAYRLFS